MRLLRRGLAAVLHNWPQKLGALLVAILIWVFIATDDTSITQRSMFVPISVEGIPESSVVTGLPEFVEITVSGPSGQIDRLRAENFEALLDLDGQSGEFEAAVRVFSPQGVELLRVNPNDVIGVVEPVPAKVVPVQAIFRNRPEPDERLLVQVEPQELTVSARASTLQAVDRAFVPLAPADGEQVVTPYAVDAAGMPVSGVSVEPETVTARVVRQPILVNRELVVDLEPPPAGSFIVTAVLDEETVSVVGPPQALDSLETVQGTVSLPTEEPRAGSYTLPVALQLPEGVVPLDQVMAVIRLSRPPVDE